MKDGPIPVVFIILVKREVGEIFKKRDECTVRHLIFDQQIEKLEHLIEQKSSLI